MENKIVSVGNANATWRGPVRDGAGVLDLKSGAYSGEYHSRSSHGPGPNPEELISAAQATCLSMTLASILTGAGYQMPDISLAVETTLLNSTELGLHIGRLLIKGEVRCDGLDDAALSEVLESAKEKCPISKLLSVPQVDIQIQRVA